MRNIVQKPSVWILVWLAFFSQPSLAKTPTELLSPFIFEETLQRIESNLLQSGMTIFTRIDHAQAADDVQMQLPKTLVLIYGNPKGGTPLMQKYPLLALDLPLRVLIREDSNHNTWVAFHGIENFALNHNLNPTEIEALNRGEQLLRLALRNRG